MSDLQEGKPTSSTVAEGSTLPKTDENESKSPSELLSKKSGPETATSENTEALSTNKDAESVVGVKQAVKEGSKDLQSPIAEDLDDKRDSSVKSENTEKISVQESEISTTHEDDHYKLFMATITKSSPESEDEATDVQKGGTVKDSRAENDEKAESSKLLPNVDSGEKTDESSKTLEKTLVVSDSNKAQKEKEGDGKMSDRPMINITPSKGKSPSKLPNKGKVLNSDFQKQAAESIRSALSAVADLNDKKVAEENMPVRSPTQIKIDYFRELEESGKSKKSPNKFSPETDPVRPFDSGLIFVPKSPVSGSASNKPSPKRLSPYSVVSIRKSPLKNSPDIVEIKDDCSGKYASPPLTSRRELFPKSKSPSIDNKSPNKSSSETAQVKQSESDISVPQSSVTSGSDITTDKPLEQHKQHVKCERQVTKPVKGKESVKTRTQSKRGIEISAPKRQAKRTDPTIIATGTRFRIQIDVSLFETENISVHIDGDKIDVYCKQVNENEFGEERHEIHQVFRIPEYVDDTCFTATITENGVLLLEAPFKNE